MNYEPANFSLGVYVGRFIGELIDKLRAEEGAKSKLEIKEAIQEWLNWAEKGWAFKEIVEKGLNNSEGESCDYDTLFSVYLLPKLVQILVDRIGGVK